jgi:hypothetical protein
MREGALPRNPSVETGLGRAGDQGGEGHLARAPAALARAGVLRSIGRDGQRVDVVTRTEVLRESPSLSGGGAMVGACRRI